MSTHGIIAQRCGEGWEGVYNHSDSYPKELGKELWDILHNKFKNNLDKFLRFAIYEHYAGWSFFGSRCYCHDESRKVHNEDSLFFINPDDDKDGYTAYVHRLFWEWLYIFDRERRVMEIWANYDTGRRGLVYSEEQERMININKYDWMKVAEVDLDGEEPDWSEIQAKVEILVELSS